MKGNAGAVKLFVRFDRSSVVGGNSMSGTVCLFVDQPDVWCTSIGCKITGREDVRIGESSGSFDDTSGASRPPECSSHTFYELNFILGRVSGTRILNGQYAYPFTFTVPADVPSSMAASLQQGDSCCAVSYTMEVWLNGAGRQKVSDLRNFSVVRPVGGTAPPLTIEPASVDLHSFCCFKMGNVLIGGSAASNRLVANSNAAIKCAAQNHSTLRVKAIEVSLYESVHFRAKKSDREKHKVLCKTRASPEQAGLLLVALPVQHGAGYDAVNDARSLSEALATASKPLEITVPADAKSSYAGKFVQVKHALRIQLITAFGTNNPFVETEVQVINMSPSQAKDRYVCELPSPPLPRNWAPTTAPRESFPAVPTPTAYAAQAPDGQQARTCIMPVAEPFSGEAAPSFTRLLEAMRLTRDPCGQLKQYLRQDRPADDLLPEELFLLFQAVASGSEQLRVAELLAASMTTITCVKVARATAGAKDACKREVVELLLTVGPVLDKAENADLVQNELSAEQWEVVERRMR